ncbi:MAG: glycine betaine/L-proline ABC transporter ATP-binding protein [Opitutales bacterium]|nr:glycine betaine/L-proline ABC transporter ATP-binding protein [Opitutales bacterium]MCH8541034.1 glycine betaine/L-proline ABC transporter ATP-binding protein [Opitutales bacterium]
MEKIVVKNLYKIFGSRSKLARDLLEKGVSKKDIQEKTGAVVGVQNANFSIQNGEIFVIMGLSGSGKSTLQRLLNRLWEPTSGSILIDGKDITKLDKNSLRKVRREHFCGMVFQQFAILPHRTVLENVAFGLEIQGVAKEERFERAQKMIDVVGLSGNEQSYPTQLSGGMQQRVGLARALTVDADILLMDEAFSALDPLIRRDMQNELLELQQKMQKTIVFVTHDLDEALRLGDRIAIMKDGEIVQLGTAEEIIAKPANDYVKAFIQDIDRSEVYTAGSIMQEPREIAHSNDGPRTILRKMQRKGLSSIFMIDTERALVGRIDADPLAAYLKENSGDVAGKVPAELVEKTLPLSKETPLQEVMVKIQQVPGPLPVLDEKKHLVGVIVRGAIIAALSSHPETDETKGEDQ